MVCVTTTQIAHTRLQLAKLYIYTDINGKPRPQDGGSDLGAYQH